MLREEEILHTTVFDTGIKVTLGKIRQYYTVRTWHLEGRKSELLPTVERAEERYKTICGVLSLAQSLAQTLL